MKCIPEYGRRDYGDGCTGQDSYSLHAEHGGDECPSRLLIRILRHDGRRQWIISPNAHSQPETEEAKSTHHGLGRVSKRHTRSDRGQNHEQQGPSIHPLPPELVTEPSKQELSTQSTTKRHTVDSSRDIWWQSPRLPCQGVVVVQSSQQTRDGGNNKEIVSVSEEPHPRDDDRLEMVPLRLGFVERTENVNSSCHRIDGVDVLQPLGVLLLCTDLIQHQLRLIPQPADRAPCLRPAKTPDAIPIENAAQDTYWLTVSIKLATLNCIYIQEFLAG